MGGLFSVGAKNVRVVCLARDFGDIVRFEGTVGGSRTSR